MFNIKRLIKIKKIFFLNKKLYKKYYYRKKIRLSNILYYNPIKSVKIIKLVIITPRKPNSARRKCSKSKYNFKKNNFNYIPGGSSNLKKFSNIFIKGKGPRDLPGVYTNAIRGVKDLYGILNKKRRRSIYGTKKNLNV